MPTSTSKLLKYYADLLIMQYVNKPRARGTVKTLAAAAVMAQTPKQQISFAQAPESGSFVLAFGEAVTDSISWNDNAETIQTKIRAIEGLEDIEVGGSIASGSLIVNLEGIEHPTPLLTVFSSTLDTGTPSVLEIDETLPIAVQNAFDLENAVGAQLDTIGKYAGVIRQAIILDEVVTLDDHDLRNLIRIAVIKNNADSSLATIQQLLFDFFPGDINVVDYGSMFLSYIVSPNVASPNLLNMFLSQDLLPKPMAVGIGLITFKIPYFGYSELTIDPPEHLEGFSEISSIPLTLDDGSFLELSNGTVLGINDGGSFSEPEGGGIYSELYGV